jgi:hypothetical protein
MKAAILIASLTACTIPDSAFDPGETGEPNPSGNPIPPHDPDPNGRYELRTTYDVTAEAVLPEPAFELVGTMRAFSTAPANTLLDVAEDAGVPAVGTLRDALPSTLETKLEGFIDEQLAKVTIDGVPITQIAGELAALAETVLTQFAIDSQLVISGSTINHRLTRIDFAPAGVDVAIDLQDLPVEQVTTCTVNHASLTIDAHAYALPYGQYAWAALEAQVVATYGKAPRALLGDAINCPAIAKAVASKCVLSLCVGHQTELTQICERGLDEVVARVQSKVEGLVFEAIRHERGVATLSDRDGDDRMDQLAGTWTAQINASQGLRPVPATFTGHRTAE